MDNLKKSYIFIHDGKYQCLMAASYQHSSCCSTRAVQKSLTKKYLRVFWGGKSTISRKIMTERAKGLGRFQKGERVGEQSW